MPVARSRDSRFKSHKAETRLLPFRYPARFLT